MQKHVIIVAGGKGLRFGSELPKQFVPLKGLPILMHSIQAFYTYDSLCSIWLALPFDHIDFWKELCQKHQFTISHNLVAGGETRFESVKNTLHKIDETEGLVAIHDGVRPLVSTSLISVAFNTAKENTSAIPCISITDSIRKVEKHKSIAVDRTLYKAIQTPQCFQLNLLKKAYQQEYRNSFTDDASVFENAGNAIYLIDGDRKNIKITDPLDLALAELFF